MRGQRASAEGGGGGLVAIIEVVLPRLILDVVPVMRIVRGRGVAGVVAERVAALDSSRDVGERGRDRRAATSTVAAEGHHVVLLLLLLLVRHEVGCVVRRERELLVLLLWELLQLLLLLLVVVVQLVGRGEVGSHLGDSVIHSSSFNLEWRKEKILVSKREKKSFIVLPQFSRGIS